MKVSLELCTELASSKPWFKHSQTYTAPYWSVGTQLHKPNQNEHNQHTLVQRINLGCGNVGMPIEIVDVLAGSLKNIALKVGTDKCAGVDSAWIVPLRGLTNLECGADELFVTFLGICCALLLASINRVTDICVLAAFAERCTDHPISPLFRTACKKQGKLWETG